MQHQAKPVMVANAEQRTRGRPRKDRVKVGLSLGRKSSEMLNKLTSKRQDTKSKVIEDLIAFYEEHEELVNARLQRMEDEKLDSYFDFDAIRETRKVS